MRAYHNEANFEKLYVKQLMSTIEVTSEQVKPEPTVVKIIDYE